MAFSQYTVITCVDHGLGPGKVIAADGASTDTLQRSWRFCNLVLIRNVISRADRAANFNLFAGHYGMRLVCRIRSYWHQAITVVQPLVVSQYMVTKAWATRVNDVSVGSSSLVVNTSWSRWQCNKYNSVIM